VMQQSDLRPHAWGRGAVDQISPVVCCPVWGDRLGIYERIVVRRNGNLGTISLLREPRLGRAGEECWPST
jgi:hypothetical protein